MDGDLQLLPTTSVYSTLYVLLVHPFSLSLSSCSGGVFLKSSFLAWKSIVWRWQAPTPRQFSWRCNEPRWASVRPLLLLGLEGKEETKMVPN